MEKWKDVKGYEGLYQVSNEGRVKALSKSWVCGKGVIHYRKEHLLKCVTSKGYLQVKLCKDGKINTLKIHRLVAEAFIPNEDNKPCIDHINTIRTDNRIENLRWCTYKENMLNPITRTKSSNSKKGNQWNKGKKQSEETVRKRVEKIKGNKHPIESIIRSANGHKKPVAQYTKEGVYIKKWNSAVDAARELGISVEGIGRVCNNKIKTSGGYIWKRI